MSGDIQIPIPVNEPVLDYVPESAARRRLKDALRAQSGEAIEIPLIIGGREVRTGNTATSVMPHRHGHVLATWHLAGTAEVVRAIEAAEQAWKDWARWPWRERAAVFLRAAELLGTRWRARINAATMLNQSKTAHQAEIDAAAELIDFFRFNAHFAERIFEDQPLSDTGVWNRMEFRPLEGFVYAITPFNFTSIGGNLPGAPALMGNTVIWKPSKATVYSNYHVFRLLEAAGLPPGVINFVPGDPREISEAVFAHPAFAGLHFTGSTSVFRNIWKTVGERIGQYRNYPRLVGETGGKDFIVAHPSAHPEALRTAIVRGAFEYQGQKCSAASRLYLPESIWKAIGDDLLHETAEIRMGAPTDFRNFMNAVISEEAFTKITGYIDDARGSDDAEILVGGESDGREGWYVRPTIIRAHRPDYRSMCEEIFGPVVTLYVYPDDRWDETLDLVDRTSPYALTGAVFAEERDAVEEALGRLRYAAGNFYINDKPTGAVVGQQPFGGSRASGTNDKAGSMLNLVRWVSPRSVKETFVPPTEYRYPFMDAE